MQGRFRIYVTAIILFLSVMLIKKEAFAFSGAGSGTESNPFVITTPAQIQEMGSNLSAHYKLGNDIDMSGINFVPIGTNAKPFMGTLDGQGFTVVNLSISQPSAQFVGLFNTVKGARIENIIFENPQIEGKNTVGVIAGKAVGTDKEVVIDNVGIVGGLIKGAANVGTLIGRTDAGTGAAPKGNISISKVYSTANILPNGAGNSYGGLTGISVGNITIEESYYAGNIKEMELAGNNNYVGGLIGQLNHAYTGGNSRLSVENSFTIGNYHTQNNAAGLIGFGSFPNLQMSNSYFAGRITAVAGNNRYGLTHNNNGNANDSYFNKTRLNVAGADAQAKTTEQMMNVDTYQNWDTVNTWFVEAGSYPYLRSLPNPYEHISLEDSIIITTPAELDMIRRDLSAKYVLGNDIDMSGINFVPIGTNAAPFKGILDGNGFAIENLTISQPGVQNIGLFGFAQGAKIENITFVNPKIEGSNCVGVIVGKATGTSDAVSLENVAIEGGIIKGISNIGTLIGRTDAGTSQAPEGSVILDKVYSTADILPNGSGSSYGGLVGLSVGNISIKESYFAGNINAMNPVGNNKNVGGLIGQINHAYIGGNSNMSVNNSFALGTYHTQNNSAGLIGAGTFPNLQVSNSYFAGSIVAVTGKNQYGITYNDAGAVSNSYFDVTKFVKTTPANQAKTTAQMQQQATYENWDFANIWYIDEGASYPQLRWHMGSVPVNETIELTGLDCPEITSTGLKFSWNVTEGAVYEAILNDGEASTITTNSIVYTNLTPNTEYTFKVRAKVGNKYSEWVSLVAFTDQIVLNPPSTVTLVSATATTLEIIWQAVEGATSYEINLDGEVINSEENAITLENLTPQTAYTVKVKAVNEVVQSEYSAEFRFTTSDIPAPSGLQFTSKGHTSISLSWDGAEGAESYEISYNGNIISSTSANIELNDLTHATAYNIKVRGVCGEIKGGWSVEILVTTNTYTLEIPIGLTSISKTSDTIEISWDGVAEAESYVISYGSDEVTSNGTTVVISDLSQHTEYVIKVKAVNQYTESSYSEPITVRTEPAPLNEPAGLIYTAKTYTSVALSWNTVAGATEYEITYGDETKSAASTNLTIDGLSPDTEYTFKVMAKNSYISGPQAEIIIRTEIPTIGIPSNIVCGEVKQESISLSWAAVAEADEYIVSYNGTQMAVNINSAVINGLLPNTEYSITIQAKNQYITGVESDAVIVKTLIVPMGNIAGLKFTDRQANSITLMWNAVSLAENYEVKYGQNVISTVDNSIIITNLAADTTYTFAVRAISEDSTSPWSNNFTVKTLKQNSVAQNETVLRIETGKTYDVVFTGNNIQGLPDKIFEIRYDESAVQLADFAAHTPAHNITTGNVSGTDLQIISIGRGVIQFKLNKTVADNKAWSGMFTIVKFKALKTGSTSVHFEQ